MSPSFPSDGLGAFLDSGEIVTFVVRDLEAARAFYVDQLRLPIEEEVPNRYVTVRLGSTRLCIDLADSEQPALGGGAVAILFSSNLPKAEQFLKEAGVPYTPGNSVCRARNGKDRVGVRCFRLNLPGWHKKHLDSAALVHATARTVDVFQQRPNAANSAAKLGEREPEAPLDPLFERPADLGVSGSNSQVHGIAHRAVSLDSLSLMDIYAGRRKIEI